MDEIKQEDDVKIKDKITVLIAEYNTLRAEEQHRLTVLIQCTTVAVTIMIALASWKISKPDTSGITYLFIFVALLYAVIFFLVDRNVFQESKKIREIERRVNNFAGERLLTWEAEYGWGGAYPRSKKKQRAIDGLDQ
jgi:hypothetical protein